MSNQFLFTIFTQKSNRLKLYQLSKGDMEIFYYE